MKAGTTSFSKMISDHDEIFFCPIKEPHHFITDTPESLYSSDAYEVDEYLKSEVFEPFHLKIIPNRVDYHKLYRASNNQKYLAEGSTGYYHSKESASMIYDYNPDAKIIILNRNPLKRAYSHYKMNSGLGRVSQPFSKLLEENINNYYKQGQNQWDYLGMSMYHNNTKRFEDLFGENVIVFEFESLISSFDEEMLRLSNFLEIDTHGLILPFENSSKEIKYKRLVKFLFSSGLKKIGSAVLPKRIRTKMLGTLQDKNKRMSIPENLLDKFNVIIKSQNNN